MKTKIICHMVSSVDGRLQMERYSKFHNVSNPNLALNVYLDLGNQMEAQAWIVGKGTVLSMGLSEVSKSVEDIPTKKTATFVGKRESKRFCVVFDSKGVIYYPTDTFEGDNIIVVLGEAVSDKYLTYLQNKGISYLFAGKEGKDLNIALSTLYKDFGIETALLEGGGVLNGNFWQARLIDEFSVLLYPCIDGLAGMSSIVEYIGNETDMPSQNQSLSLTDVQKLEMGLVWLRYDVHQEK